MLSPTHPNAPKAPSTHFLRAANAKGETKVSYMTEVSKDKNNLITHLGAQLCGAWPGALPQGRLMKGTPKMDGTSSKALTPPHTNYPVVKRKPGKMAQGTFGYSGLRLSRILIYSVCPKNDPRSRSRPPPFLPALLPGAGLRLGMAVPAPSTHLAPSRPSLNIYTGPELGASFPSQKWAHSSHLCIFRG